MNNSIENNNYKCIISIGMRCFTEIFLKKLNLKKFSCVFDAMYNNNIKDIIYIMENKINYDDIILSYNIECNHVKKLDKKLGNRTLYRKINYREEDLIYSYHHALIPHHDLNKEYHKEHFERCFERLAKIKNNKIKTLFCLFIHPYYGKDYRIKLHDIIFLKNYLIKNYNCCLLVCNFEKQPYKWTWECIIKSNELIYININNNSHSFEDNKEVLYEIISFIDINEKNLLSYNDIKNI